MAGPRSIWNGTIAFGLVHVPIKVFSANEDKAVRFREVHLDDGAAIEHKRWCPKHDEEIPYDDVVKGYEVSEGKWVELTKDEVAAAAGARAKIVELEDFVPAEDIDPVVYGRTYYLGPGKDGEDPYKVLLAALEQSERAGIGRWTFHDRERLVAVRPHGDVLALSVLRFADELVEAKELDIPSASRKTSPKEVEMAGRLVDTLAEDFKPDAYEDTYREAVLDVVKRKAKGEEIERVDEPQEESDDLAAMLQASLDGGRK